MAKSKFFKSVEPIESSDLVEEVELDEKSKETETVIGIALAEELQKSGWQLIDCHLTPNGKEYKFRKVN